MRPRQASQRIRRPLDAVAATVQHVRVDRRRPQVLAAKRFLHRPNVGPVFQKTGRERVSEGVA